MKHYFKRIIALTIVLVITFAWIPMGALASDRDVIVLFTNDVHCSTEDYAVLAAYRAELIAQGNTVVMVDAGDHIQGELVGSFTQGNAIIELMNAVGYDFAVPGNHEFDYGMDTYMSLAESAEFTYLSCNFIDLLTGNSVFDAYEIMELDGMKVAFVGITTPECYTKSTPAYFQDENGNYIYSFREDNFYSTIQNAVDSAIEEGAEQVIAISHLGIDGTTEGWKSTDVIANTTGIDVVLDGHSHERIESRIYKDKSNNDVVLSTTGSKFESFGQLTIEDNGAVELELIDPSSINVETFSDSAQNVYNTVKDIDDNYQARLDYLYEVLGTAEVELSIYDAEGNWVVRKQETNMGDFVADAYRIVSGAEIGFANAGGIRSSIAAGEVTRKDLMDVNPWDNKMCVIRVTGQQIVNALEHGARLYPETSGGFVQVSGMSYEIRNDVESPVVCDERGNFVKVDETKERRVINVKVAGKDIDLKKTYTLAGNYYMLKQGGDGFTMFADAEVLEHDTLPTDAEMLIKYFVEHLNGVVTEEKYGSMNGDGRIKVVTAENTGSSDGESLPPNGGSSEIETAPNTGDNSFVVFYAGFMVLSFTAIVVLISCKKKEVMIHSHARRSI
ncbi:MAG: bifunctional UDP-sugar hydrolase/5'-nucleotidase [Faecalimonas sp.]|nr:bifunctional UDP-sugar hydrolase/5'-nucleotidase [Faecalimonas sp.]